jgi:subtilase family serine protease
MCAGVGYAQPLAESTFDTGTEGWSVVGDASPPQHVSSGGSPGGYIDTEDNQSGEWWYWSAPSSFLNAGAGSYGGSLQFALTSSPIGDEEEVDDIRLEGNGMTLVYTFPYNPGATWTPYQAPLLASQWVVESTGAAPTRTEMEEVLANLDELLIRGEYVSGDDTGGLDSVALTAEGAVPQYASEVIDFSSQWRSNNYSAEQALNKPDVYPEHRDNSNAWASSTADESREFLAFGFASARPASGIAVFETLNPGAVDTMYVRNASTQQWEQVWSGTASEAGDQSRVFLQTFPETSFDVDAVRIALNSEAVPGFNEVDAIALLSSPIESSAGTNYALEFGGDDHVAVGNADEINTSDHDQRTIEFWFRANNPGVDTHPQVIYEEGGPNAGFNVYLRNDSLYVGAWNEKNGWDGRWLSSARIRANRWHHVALVFNHPDGIFEGYLDGSKIGKSSAPVVMSGHFDAIKIGNVGNNTKLHDERDFNGNAPFEGVLDEGRIWNTARTAAEIEANRFGSLTGEEADLVAYWPFNEGQGTTTADVSGNGNPGTLNGATWRTVELPGEAGLRIADEGAFASTELTFAWSSVDSDATYQLELASSPDSNTVIETFDADSLTSYSVDATTLQEGETYYARVLGSTDGGATYSYRSGFTNGVTVDRTPPSVDRPVGQLTNQANVSFSVTGSDNVRLDSFRVQISDDQSFGSVLKTVSIRPNQSAVYDGERGTTYYARAKAIDAAGQESSYSNISVGIPIPERPDLTVSDVGVPEEGFSGQPIQVTWAVSNEGNAGTNAPTWRDAVYLSEDDTFDPDADTRLGEAKNVSFLAVGDQYEGQAEVALPQGLEGTYHVFVQTDGEGQMAESDESNNAGGAAFTIELSPYPDLEVTDLQVPSTAFSGDTIQVSWTVKNKGTGPADLDEWSDSAFLSPDSTLDYNFVAAAEDKIRINEPRLSTTRHQGTLAVDSSYTMSARIPLPIDSIGAYTLFVYPDMPGGGKQDKRGAVFEYNQELDNWAGDPIDISLTPPPDLAVESVEGPRQASSGEEVEVTWTVQNEGPGSTPSRSDSWNDAIYFSRSSTFDTSSVEILEVVSRTGELASDERYTLTRSVQIPDGVEGEAHFFVDTDWNDDVFEHTFEDNNRGGTTTAASLTLAPYPDLKASDLRVKPLSMAAGQQVEARYTIRNDGEAGAERWADSLYISTSATWDPDLAQSLRSVAQEQSLGVGEERQRTVGLKIPPNLVEGTYYVYASADAAGQTFELPDTTSNRARSPALSVEEYPPVDLAAQIEAVPSAVDAGATIEPSITITNIGRGRTRTDTWSDAVYLSADSVLEESDRRLTQNQHERGLRGGKNYALSPSLSIPPDLEGDYYLLVVNDEERVLSDADPANNRLVQPLSIQRPAPSDLAVTSIEVDSASTSGQPLTIAWTIENQGSGPTQDSTWYEALYLSRDPTLSEGDVRLGKAKKTEALASGSTYRDSVTAEVPLFASGSYYVLLQTDSRDDVYEHQAETNNLDSTPIELTLPPPSDLQVTGIEAPSTAQAGDSVTVSWTIENIGDNPATGTMREGLFLSQDSTWDPGDPFLGSLGRSISLDPGQSKRGTMDVNLAKAYKAGKDGEISRPLPGVPPGEYHVLVRTDIADNIRERNNENNLTASSSTLASSVSSLGLGSPTTFEATSESNRYFQVDVTEGGKDLVLELTSDASEGATQMYVRRGAVPTPNDHDFASDEPFTLEHEITVPNAESGTYYVQARVQSLPESGGNLELSVRTPSFSIRKVSPDHGGNGGVVTIKAQGAQFEPDASLFLQADDGTRTAAQGTYVQNSSLLKGRFNLRDQATGSYDLVVQHPDGSEAVKPDAFTVEASEGADPYVELVGPTAVRSQRAVKVDVVVGNRGNENAVDLFLTLGAQGIFFPSIVSGGGGAKVEDGRGPQPVKMTDSFPLPQGVTLNSDRDTTSFTADGPRETQLFPIWFYELPPGQEQRFTITISHAIPGGSIRYGGWFVEMPDSKFKRTASPEDIETAVGYEVMRKGIDSAIEEALSKSGHRAALTDLMKAIGSLGNPIPGKTQLGFAAAGAAAGVVGCAASVGCGAVAGAAAIGAAAGFSVGGFVGGVTGTAEYAKEGVGGAFEDVADALTGRTEIRRSQDPNDIVGPGGPGDQNWVRPTQRLGYKIRFENDPDRATAPAQVVEIRHPLDEDVDARTFELGSFGFGDFTFEVPDNRASYSDRLDVTDSLGVYVDVNAGLDIQDNEAFWRFTSIDPATGSQPSSDPFAGFLPVNDSTGRGEGFVRYRVQPVSNASTGTEIKAEADIVFDQNEPIETPVVVNTVDADAPQSEITVAPQESQDNAFKLNWGGTDTGSGLDRFQLYVAKGDSGRFERYTSSTQDTTVIFVGDKNATYRFYTRATDFVGNQEPPKSVGDTTRTLPVELTDFTATQRPGQVVLQWSTASEINNAGFYVQRSAGDAPFEDVQFVEGNGTTSEPHTYRFRDTDVPFEVETLTYRLRQVDTDGTTSRSEPLVVKRTDPQRFALHSNYPNPPTQQTTIPYEVARSSQVDVRLYDILGRQVMSGPLGRKDPGRYTHVLDVSRLASGVYFFELRAEQDGKTFFREVEKITVVQ